MSYSSGRLTRKNKYSEVNMHRHQSIKEHLEKIAYRNSFSARCINGVCEVDFHGHFIPLAEFNKLVPLPIVNDFNADLTNVDKTKAFML